MLCGISDVYDAMRSQRVYQKAFPSRSHPRRARSATTASSSIQHLVRRFVQLIGIYPPGNVVRLDTGEIAVVLRVYAPTRTGRACASSSTGRDGRLERQYDVNLWESTPGGQWPESVETPVDPEDYHLDPLTLL